MAPHVLGAVCLLLPWFSGLAASQEPPSEVLERVAASTVSIRVEGASESGLTPVTGRGFFVHSSGLVLTDVHLLDGRARTSEHPVTSAGGDDGRLVVVIGSRSQREERVPARVIALDRQRGLALLAVDARPKGVIDLGTVQDVRVGRTVWIFGNSRNVGSAAGKFTSGDEVAGLGAAFRKATVISLSRSESGALLTAQTDVALRPENCGGPVVDSGGRLVGVVHAGVSADRSTNSILASGQIREFYRRQAVRIVFSPPVVRSPAQPIEVSITSILLESGLEGGELSFDGGDIDPYTLDLKAADEGRSLTGTIVFPDRIPGRNRPEKYFATLTLFPRSGENRIRRRFSLRAVNGPAVGEGGQIHSGGTDDRGGVFPQSVVVLDRKVGDSGANRPRLSDVAGSMHVGGDDSDSVVLDNSLVKEVGAPRMDPERYRFIHSPELREQLEDYDRLGLDIAALERSLRHAMEGITIEEYIHGLSLNEKIVELKREKEQLRRKLSRAKVRWCEDAEFYFIADGKRADYPCERSSGFL